MPPSRPVYFRLFSSITAGQTGGQRAEKAGEISKDDLERAEKELEKMTHENVEQIDKAFTRKEQELLEV